MSKDANALHTLVAKMENLKDAEELESKDLAIRDCLPD
jgi:hypothetical protein